MSRAEHEISYPQAVHLAQHVSQVVILGPPKSGKTTLANLTNRRVLHTDNFIRETWTKQRTRVAEWAARHDTWLIEGVTAARCLKHGELGRPLVLYLPQPMANITPRAKQLGESVYQWLLESKVDYVLVNRKLEEYDKRPFPPTNR